MMDFSYQGRSYRIKAGALECYYSNSRHVKLPDGKILAIVSWKESCPPQPCVTEPDLREGLEPEGVFECEEVMTFFTHKGKSYLFDSWACYKNGSPYFIGLPDGKVLTVARWDHENDPFKKHESPPQPTRIFNMDMSLPEGAKVFPATEVTY